MTAAKHNREQPWWDRLPDDFYRHRFAPDIAARHAGQVRITAAADRVLRSGLSALASLGMCPTLWPRAAAHRELERLRVYQRLADRADTAAVFPKPSRPRHIHRTPARGGLFQCGDVRRERLRFDSDYRPLHPEVRQRYSRNRRNRVAHAEHWTHADGPRPTLIFVHGIVLSPYWVNSRAFCLSWFYEQGYDIVLYTLPFHGARRARHELYSGQGYLSGGLSGLNEAMCQAVHDLRVLIDHILARGAPSVGISGLSLGGYVAALLGTVDERLAFCIPNSPLVAPIDMALEWQPTGSVLRWIMRRHGIGVRELRHGTALHSPLTYAPALDADRLMIIGGAGDRFTSPHLVNLLHEHWAGSHLHWFPGNHILHLQQGDYLRLMKRFMDDHCYA